MHRDDSYWASLMAAAQNGDQQSYARLLRDVTPLLRRLARQRWPMGSMADIEDVVQETLLTLHASRHTYDPSRPFMPWMLTLLHRRVADGVRRRARTNRREIPIDALDVTSLPLSTNDKKDCAADEDTLREAISRLPDSQKQAIELLKQKEMSLKEASGITGLSIAALKVATHRALKTLRTVLAVGKKYEDR